MNIEHRTSNTRLAWPAGVGRSMVDIHYSIFVFQSFFIDLTGRFSGHGRR